MATASTQLGNTLQSNTSETHIIPVIETIEAIYNNSSQNHLFSPHSNLIPTHNAVKDSSFPLIRSFSPHHVFMPHIPDNIASPTLPLDQPQPPLQNNVYDLSISHHDLGFTLLGAAIYRNNINFIKFLSHFVSPKQFLDALFLVDNNEKVTFNYIFYLPPLDQLRFLQLFHQIAPISYTAFSIHPIFFALQPPKQLYVTECRQIILYFLRTDPTAMNPIKLFNSTNHQTLLHAILAHFCPLSDFIHMCGGSKHRNGNPSMLLKRSSTNTYHSTLLYQEQQQHSSVENMVYQFLDEVVEIVCTQLFDEQLVLFPLDPHNNKNYEAKPRALRFPYKLKQ